MVVKLKVVDKMVPDDAILSHRSHVAYNSDLIENLYLMVRDTLDEFKHHCPNRTASILKLEGSKETCCCYARSSVLMLKDSIETILEIKNLPNEYRALLLEYSTEISKTNQSCGGNGINSCDDAIKSQKIIRTFQKELEEKYPEFKDIPKKPAELFPIHKETITQNYVDAFDTAFQKIGIDTQPDIQKTDTCSIKRPESTEVIEPRNIRVDSEIVKSISSVYAEALKPYLEVIDEKDKIIDKLDERTNRQDERIESLLGVIKHQGEMMETVLSKVTQMPNQHGDSTVEPITVSVPKDDNLQHYHG